MATYSKETALYDTGAIADDIAGAGNTANYYLTTISGTSGISVHNKNDTSNYVNINSTDGMNVVKGGTNVAQFGTTARVGSASSSHFNMNASSLQAYDSNNNKYFEVSSSGITYGSNTVANTSDVSNAVNAVEVYSLDSSYPSVTVDTNGSHPTSLTLSSTYTKGSAAPASYAGRIKVETSTDNTNWTALYTSSSNESSKTITTPTNVEDSEPYVFRQTPSGAGNAVDDSAIVGGTIAWNQLVKNGDFANGTTNWAHYTDRGTVEVENGIAVVTPSATNEQLYQAGKPFIKDHVLLTIVQAKTPTSKLYIGTNFGGVTYIYPNGSWQTVGNIVKATSTPSYTYVYIGDGSSAGQYGEWQIKTVMCFDLTQMFGSTIADYILSLETATAGAGVAYFKKLGFTKPYYAYNAGELMSVNAVGQKTVGFNQWDEEWELGTYNITTGAKEASNDRIRSKNYIKVLPDISYYMTVPAGNTNTYIYFYDADKNYISYISSQNATFVTPSNCYYMTFRLHSSYGTTYKNDICINIAWDNSRNGEYEPYELHSYPLDSNLTLRGIPKLDSANNLYYDGDTYESDGTVTRKYGIVDLGTLVWYSQSVDSQKSYYGNVPTAKAGAWGNIITADYIPASYTGFISAGDRRVTLSTGKNININDNRYETVQAFKTAMSGVYLVYELATPTTETAQSFTSLKSIDAYGTERYIDGLYEAGTRDVAVPVGHISKYASGIKSIRASLYKAGGTTTLLAQKIIPFTANLGGTALNQAIDAAQTATTYITAIDDDGIKVHASNNPNSNYSKIDAEGLEVYKGGSSVAAFGVETRIGQRNASRVELESNRIALIAENGLSALEAVTSGKEISAIYDVYGIDARLPSNTSNNVFTIDMSGVAIDAPFYVTIVSRYVYTLTISTQYNVWSADFNKGCDSVRIGFTKKTQTESKSGTLKMVSALTAQYDPTPIVTTTDKSVTVAYNATNSTLTITTPTYPTIADSQYAYGYGTNFITRGDSYLEVSAVSASFSKYIPKTEIYGRTYLEMNTGLGLPDEIDESILTSLNALGWRQDCIE